jgi:hypothetical protein
MKMLLAQTGMPVNSIAEQEKGKIKTISNSGTVLTKS